MSAAIIPAAKSIFEAVSLLTSLVQLASRLTAEAAQLSAMIERARAEGRDLTDAELEQARKAAVAALARLS